MSVPLPVQFGNSSESSEGKGFLERAKSGFKVLLPAATLAAGVMYQNANSANMVKYLAGMEKNFSKLIADNAPKPLSTAKWLWQNTKGFFISTVPSVSVAYFLRPTPSQNGVRASTIRRFGRGVVNGFDQMAETVGEGMDNLGQELINQRRVIVALVPALEAISNDLQELRNVANTNFTNLLNWTGTASNSINQLTQDMNHNFRVICAKLRIPVI
jgi:hypothetical protein